MLKRMLKGYLSKRGQSIVSDHELEQLRGKKEFNHYIESQKYLEHGEYKYILWLDRVYQKIAKVPGHIVELGVAYGRNSIIFGHQIKMNGDEMVRRYYGFDTFSGFNEESLKMDKHLNAEAWKDNSRIWVQDKIKRVGLGNLCELIEGDILAEVPKFLEQKTNFRAALLYVDCNAYLPSIKGMELFKPYLSPGAVICIDEKQQGGETKALIEFCEKNGLEFQKDASPFSIPAYTVIK